MTYTFKLSRRLAVSRYAMLAAAAMLVSCDGDTTAPQNDPGAPQSATPWIRVVPSAVTIETNQTIRFRGERRSPRGEAHDLRLTWHASGGSITDDGFFTAAEPGVYKVVGRGRGRQKPDTSIVVVVPPQGQLRRITVAPDTATIPAGGSHGFTATGVRKDGTLVAIGVTWHATGGTIDDGGGYTAGNAAGSYRVIARSLDSTLADTATVTITEPPPPPSPPPPTLARVVLRPASLALATGGKAQFTAFGRTSLGDSVAVEVSFSATGGSVTTTGLYTAGPMAGTYRVVAEADGLADTSVVTLNSPAPPPPPPPPSTGRRIAFGASQLWSSLGTSGTEVFDLVHDGVRAKTIIQRLEDARARNVRLLLNMTGGHDPYLTNGVFDMRKWRDSMDTYKTAAIRDAVARAVADGVLIGNSVMDEPHVNGSGTDGNTWGPTGTMTKLRVDSMCAYVKAIFPTLPVGVVHQHSIFEPDKSYRVCEFLVDQYASRRSTGTPEEFRDGALALAKRDGMRILFGANELNGGPQDRDGVWDCKDQGGLKGQSAPNCQIPPDSLRRWYPILARAGCAFRVWRWDDRRTNTAAYKAARLAVLDSLAGATSPTCARP